MQGSFYAEFVQPPLGSEPRPTPPQLAGGAASSQADSMQTVLRSVQAAVLAVLGAGVGPGTPLMEAGLDSLGGRLAAVDSVLWRERLLA